MTIPEFDEVIEQIIKSSSLLGIPFDQRKLSPKFFICLISMTITMLGETAFFISNFSEDKFLELTQVAPCLLNAWLAVFKIIAVVCMRKNVFNSIRCLKKLYERILEDPKKQKIAKNDVIFLKYLVKYFFILTLAVATAYSISSPIIVCYHYFTKNVVVYTLPFAVLYPFSTDVWYTWLIVYVHSVTSGYICVLFMTTVDALYYIITSHICVQFALLSDEIQNLDTHNHQSLGAIVKRHQYTLKLSEEIGKIFQIPILLSILCASIEICVLGFNLTMGKKSDQPAVILFLILILIQMLGLSIFGENLIKESSKIATSAYQCKWYNMDKIAKKSIFLLILRANKPQQVKAYKFSVISYESFAKIISTSWSYFTILQTVYTPPEINNE